MPPNKASITVNETELHYGDSISFTYQDPKPQGHTGIDIKCYQDGQLVYNAGYWPIADSYPLSSGIWTGGAAQGTADLLDITHDLARHKVVASTTFEVLD